MGENRKITVDSTGWYNIEVEAICNYKDDIQIGGRVYNKKHTCYTKKIKLTLPETDELYELLKHIKGDCIEEKCVYCQEAEE